METTHRQIYEAQCMMRASTGKRRTRLARKMALVLFEHLQIAHPLNLPTARMSPREIDDLHTDLHDDADCNDSSPGPRWSP